MQVHAVPDSERAFDSSGRRLPWAYEYADAPQPTRRIPEERGPFGKRRPRGTSRSRTGTPGVKQDQARAENDQYVDQLFAQTKKQEERKRESLRARNAASLPVSASAPNLGEGAALGSSFQTSAPTSAISREPTEVIIYGYGSEVQWAAIDYFEKVSNGIIYEEYDRQPPNTRYNFSLSQQHAQSYRSLSKGSLRRINTFVGGNHWIKVTFDSPEAAERACHYSPHTIQGFTVHAERYRGTGPNEDAAILAVPGSRGASQTASPNTASSSTLRYGESSTTVSSATATTSMAPSSMPPRLASEPVLRGSGAFPVDDLYSPTEPTMSQSSLRSPSLPSQQPLSAAGTTTALQPTSSQPHPKLRVRGAKPMTLLSAETAFLPAPSPLVQTLATIPVVNWMVGSNTGIIGDQVPRKEDGSFDHVAASLYWRACYAVDQCFGSNICGLRGGEDDD